MSQRIQGHVTGGMILGAALAGLGYASSHGRPLPRPQGGGERAEAAEAPEILSVLLWGGPVACLVNASISTPLFIAAGVIPPSATLTLKFSPPGGTVEVGLTVEPAWVEVSVHSGPGIPADFQPLMFRTHAASAAPAWGCI